MTPPPSGQRASACATVPSSSRWQAVTVKPSPSVRKRTPASTSEKPTLGQTVGAGAVVVVALVFWGRGPPRPGRCLGRTNRNRVEKGKGVDRGGSWIFKQHSSCCI